ncbi:uncharacterized protein ASCRUDRAFT_77148, partial [Ascoidea rubescens DSM 1968]
MDHTGQLSMVQKKKKHKIESCTAMVEKRKCKYDLESKKIEKSWKRENMITKKS